MADEVDEVALECVKEADLQRAAAQVQGAFSVMALESFVDVTPTDNGQVSADFTLRGAELFAENVNTLVNERMKRLHEVQSVTRRLEMAEAALEKLTTQTGEAS